MDHDRLSGLYFYDVTSLLFAAFSLFVTSSLLSRFHFLSRLHRLHIYARLQLSQMCISFLFHKWKRVSDVRLRILFLINVRDRIRLIRLIYLSDHAEIAAFISPERLLRI